MHIYIYLNLKNLLFYCSFVCLLLIIYKKQKQNLSTGAIFFNEILVNIDGLYKNAYGDDVYP